MPSSPKDIRCTCSSVSLYVVEFQKAFFFDLRLYSCKIAEVASTTILAQWSPTSYKYVYNSISIIITLLVTSRGPLCIFDLVGCLLFFTCCLNPDINQADFKSLLK